MTKKLALFILMIVIFGGSSAQAGFLSSKIDNADKLVAKAQGLMRVNMNSDAEKLMQDADKLIREAILANPTNAQSHYEAGLVYLKMNWNSSANDRFDAVKKLNSHEYTKKIALLYKDKGDAALSGKRWNEARSNYQIAANYDKDQLGVICKKLLDIGKGERQDFDKYFDVALGLNNALGADIATYFYQKSLQCKDDAALHYLSVASRYDGQYKVQFESTKKAIGMAYLQKAKEFGKVVGKEGEVKKYRDLASKYLERYDIDKEFPAYIVLMPGETIIDLNAGEQSQWYITSSGHESNVRIMSTNPKFKVVYDDGKEIEIWKPESKGDYASKNQKWKFVAVENTSIKLIIK